jgi:hypothetical protein
MILFALEDALLPSHSSRCTNCHMSSFPSCNILPKFSFDFPCIRGSENQESSYLFIRLRFFQKRQVRRSTIAEFRTGLLLPSREFCVDRFAQRTLTARHSAVLQNRTIQKDRHTNCPGDGGKMTNSLQYATRILPAAWCVDWNCLAPKILIDSQFASFSRVLQGTRAMCAADIQLRTSLSCCYSKRLPPAQRACELPRPRKLN